jgi:hypothetical protein
MGGKVSFAAGAWRRNELNTPGDVIRHHLLDEGEWVVLGVMDLRGNGISVGGKLKRLEYDMVLCRRLRGDSEIDWSEEAGKGILLPHGERVGPVRRLS